jgi:hypothetical protein
MPGNLDLYFPKLIEHVAILVILLKLRFDSVGSGKDRILHISNAFPVNFILSTAIHS